MKRSFLGKKMKVKRMKRITDNDSNENTVPHFSTSKSICTKFSHRRSREEIRRDDIIFREIFKREWKIFYRIKYMTGNEKKKIGDKKLLLPSFRAIN